MDDAQTRHMVEEALADSQPFGDCGYIWRRVCLHYRRRVEMLSEYSEHARRFLSVLDDTPLEHHRRLLGDPAVRVAIDCSLRSMKMGREPFSQDDLGMVFRIAATNIDTGATVPPLGEGSDDYFRVYDGSWPWVWSEKRTHDDPLGDFFRRFFSQQHQGLVLSTPDARTRESLLAGVRLLHTLHPQLCRSAMSHVHLVAIVDAGPSARFTSLTNPCVPGTIVLSPSVLRTPWQAAEVLLHEALHVKFIDLEHTHSLLSEHYDVGGSPSIRPHWNRAHAGDVNEWPVNRSLTVLHVYTCLALFFSAVANRSASLEAEFGPLHGMDPAKQARRAFDRAHYLRHQLEQHKEHLGFAGQLFIRWLGDVLRSFDPSPPPEDVYVHLLLDLYEREASEFRAVIAYLEGDPLQDEQFWAESIRKVARREIAATLAALSMIPNAPVPPAGGALPSQDEALAALENTNSSFHDSADAFLSVRSSFSQTLRRLTGASYPGLAPGNGEHTAQDVIREMVEDSGRDLNVFFEAAYG